MAVYMWHSIYEDFFFDSSLEETIHFYLNNVMEKSPTVSVLLSRAREPYHSFIINEPENWLDAYNEIVFFQLYRMKKPTFLILLEILLTNDNHNLIKKKYRGGNYPLQPEKALLMFLWYISKEDTLIAMAERFRVVPSTIMQIVNAFLYVILGLKKTYIVFPSNEEECETLAQQFESYPGVIGAVDGTQINLKVPNEQHDSYVDRCLSHSINLMAICTPKKLFSYIFVGFPGSAHDSRVFGNSSFVRNIERYRRQCYFPTDEYHLIGDSAFPLRTWLMTPYKSPRNLTRVQRHHNYCLSSARVCIENTFGLLKGRWRRLRFINTYSISKAIEITTAACILHNFCYIHNDEWDQEFERDVEEIDVQGRDDERLGRLKRDRIAQYLFQQNM